jgi:large subunit ribosomal protein L3
VPGVKGGWITVRDSVKKKAPKDLPKPGKFKLVDNESTAPIAVGQESAGGLDAPASQAAPASQNAPASQGEGA